MTRILITKLITPLAVFATILLISGNITAQDNDQTDVKPLADTLIVNTPAERLVDSTLQDSLPLLTYKLYYQITVDLPGKTADSYCKGRFQVRHLTDIFYAGEIHMTDLSTEESRVFRKDVEVFATNLDSLLLSWNFRGVLYDSQFDCKYGPLISERELLDTTIEGVGFHFQVNPNSTITMDKRVYRK